MNSLIFIAKKKDIINSYLDTFYQTHAISTFDRTTISEEGSIGIEVVRKMQEGLYLKPYKGEKKSIVIQNAHLLTIEAQNALLKVLEEPPYFVFFVLLASTTEAFLPTILSRCQLIIGEKEDTTISKEDEATVMSDLSVLLESTPLGDRLHVAEKLAGDKEQLDKWFESAIQLLRQKLLAEVANKKDATQTARIITCLQEAVETHQTTNVNIRMLLEHTFLSL